MTEIDIIMLSNANTVKRYWMTHNAVQSILKSSKDIKFNILVFETATKMPSTDTRPVWKEDKCYSTKVLPGNIIRVDQVEYSVPSDVPIGKALFINEFSYFLFIVTTRCNNGHGT